MMGGSNEASLNQGSMGNVGFDDRTPEKWARFKKNIYIGEMGGGSLTLII